MKKYVCSVRLSAIIEAENKEQACDDFMECYDMADLYPDCKEYRKKRKEKKIK